MTDQTFYTTFSKNQQMTSGLEFWKIKSTSEVSHELEEEEDWTLWFKLSEKWNMSLYLHVYKCSCKQRYVTGTFVTSFYNIYIYIYLNQT